MPPQPKPYDGGPVLKRLVIRNRGGGRLTLELELRRVPTAPMTVWGARPCSRGVTKPDKCPRLGWMTAPQDKVTDITALYFMKHGAYVELEQPVMRDLDAVARVDGMVRLGNVPVGAFLTSQSWMIRETLGVAYTIERNLRLKGSVEYYEFSEADASGNVRDLAFHLGVTGTF